MKMVHLFSVSSFFLFTQGSVSVKEAAHLALTWFFEFYTDAVCPQENAL